MKVIIKCLLTLTLIIFLSVSGYATKLVKGSGEDLSTIHSAYVEIDLSVATSKQKILQYYLELDKKSESRIQFDNDIQDIKTDFVKEFNKIGCPIKIGLDSSVETILRIVVNKVSIEGNHVWCDYIFQQKGSEDPIAIISMDSKNGRYGSFTNLMGDAFRTAGEDLAKFIKKAIKQGYKAEN